MTNTILLLLLRMESSEINKIIPFSIPKYFLLLFYRESRVLGNRRCIKKRKGAYNYVLSVILD